MTPCPAIELLSAFIEGGLDRTAYTLIERHVSECSDCRAIAECVAWSLGEVEAEMVEERWRNNEGVR